ncbi:AAA family ATPase [Thiohalocapsa marina]|uniref:AAA family ATPase n=1 Tax=Thiohalocapsa marina TaxID=424902 RepID=A0A5M8FLV5_9GAMM|nr:AAA family ATPase [Thiohalocapsa marina]KAA6184696.1 AAA family ATPase [Thiohalocapsa marina]
MSIAEGRVDLQRLAELAPRPATLAETGLGELFASDLLSKHLATSGVLDQLDLAGRLGLPGNIVEEVISFLRAEGRVQLHTQRDDSRLLRYGLTERGRLLAMQALERDGYLGPAPVTIADYRRVVAAQSAGTRPVTRQEVHASFTDVVIAPELLDRLGPAMRAGRSVFIHGHPGTGKTYVSRRMSRLLGDPVLLPQAVLVNDSVINYYDAGSHKAVDLGPQTADVRLQAGFDGRYRLCERPAVTVGGELTLDMLELQYDVATRQYTAPLQMRANTGLFLIDDLGRQRVSVQALLNRWIVPLEEQRDQLWLKTGAHFYIPFDMVLIFSTNLPPHSLADEAFLRRIGYKVTFEPATREEYITIWEQACAARQIPRARALVDYLLGTHYEATGRPLLQCHPRDLLGLAEDYARYMNYVVDERVLDWAWNNYFVDSGAGAEGGGAVRGTASH